MCTYRTKMSVSAAILWLMFFVILGTMLFVDACGGDEYSPEPPKTCEVVNDIIFRVYGSVCAWEDNCPDCDCWKLNRSVYYSQGLGSCGEDDSVFWCKDDNNQRAIWCSINEEECYVELKEDLLLSCSFH